ncbi:hypothetical protein NQZ68_024812 [Dissostichus eleginoides]|nr:hypothetical protein NQZ68_024812 [Dissostichus eleginoides]
MGLLYSVRCFNTSGLYSPCLRASLGPYLEAVEAQDDRSRYPSWGRLGREAPVSSVKLGGRSKNLRAEGINEELREEGRRAGTFDRFRVDVRDSNEESCSMFIQLQANVSQSYARSRSWSYAMSRR